MNDCSVRSGQRQADPLFALQPVPLIVAVLGKKNESKLFLRHLLLILMNLVSKPLQEDRAWRQPWRRLILYTHQENGGASRSLSLFARTGTNKEQEPKSGMERFGLADKPPLPFDRNAASVLVTESHKLKKSAEDENEAPFRNAYQSEFKSCNDTSSR
ncbi:hypothetical protein DNTS_008719, partial [Danionella cerebrum]